MNPPISHNYMMMSTDAPFNGYLFVIQINSEINKENIKIFWPGYFKIRYVHWITFMKVCKHA